eukprot:COSAG06_NODE_1058_length_10898_cov_2.841374_3_plen_101_part_00
MVRTVGSCCGRPRNKVTSLVTFLVRYWQQSLLPPAQQFPVPIGDAPPAMRSRVLSPSRRPAAARRAAALPRGVIVRALRQAQAHAANQEKKCRKEKFDQC